MLENIDDAACVLFENDAQIKIGGKKIWVASSGKTRTLVRKIFVNLWRLVFIQLVKIKFQPTLTISHLEGPNLANLLTVAGGRRIIFVHNAFSHSYSEGSFVNFAKKLLARYLYKRADTVVGVSSFICEELKSDQGIDSKRVLFLPNPINIDRIKRSAEQKYEDSLEVLTEQNYIICVGSLTTQKNHRLAIEAFAALRQRAAPEDNLKLLIVGDGLLRQDLINCGKALGLKVCEYGFGDSSAPPDLLSDLFFLGFQPSPYRLVKFAKVFVLTSKWEGLPIALLEALALETPVVTSNCSSSIEFVMRSAESLPAAQEGNIQYNSYGERGFIISPLKEESDADEVIVWRDAINRILASRMAQPISGKRCLEAVQRFDVPQVKKEWEKIFKDRIC